MMPRPAEPRVSPVADRETARVAVLAALACVLQVAESMLPHPIPGVRFGLANMVTLIALVQLGARRAVGVVLLRTVVSSVVLGTFLTPAFVLSFSAGLVSTLVMILFHAVPSRRGPLRFGLVGISVAGAVAHVLTQLGLVYLLFVTSRGVWLLWPWLALAAIVTGTTTGLIAGQVFSRLEEVRPGRAAAAPDREESARLPRGQYSPGTSLLHRAPAALKIGVVMALGVLLVVRPGLPVYAGVLVVLAMLTVASGTRTVALLRGLGRLLALTLFAFVMPVLFTPWGRVLITAGPLTVTLDGLGAGLVFAGRIVLLYWATALLAATSAPDDLATGLARLLSPLRLAGIRVDRVAQALSLAWAVFPQLWQDARRLIRTPGGAGGLRESLLAGPASIVANLYWYAEQVSGSSVAPAPEPPPAGRAG